MEEVKQEESKKCKGHKVFIIVIILIAMSISFGCGFLFSEKLKDNDKKEANTISDKKDDNANTNTATPEPLVDNEPLPEGYDANSYYGKATVRGYVTTKKVTSGDVVTDNSPTYDMVFFNITESNSNKFMAFVDSYGSSGNSYASGKAIAIGCVKDGKLVHYNDSDEFGMKEYELSEADTTKLMNTTKEATITLEIERYKFTGGSGAPDCYSHISTIAIEE
ncbi:MAG: hypothetical protein IKH36_02915 [Bacilli bacterium]|nr:hypothetical protein [Bacilli bacterium]MBR4672041.1 hypothetical protein [Bacilli bacterium]